MQQPVIFHLISVFLLCTYLPLGITRSPLKSSSSITSSPGLYDKNDKVVILNEGNFKESVVQQNYAALIEFYNSYCGHCKRFAPVYKELAEYIHPWRDVVKVMAIDCAAEENNGICREYEVMAYPTMRYFSPKYQPSENNYGEPIITQNKNEIAQLIASHVANETVVNGSWPIFADLSEGEASNLFQGLPDNVKFMILMLNSENASEQTILNFHPYPELRIRSVSDDKLADRFHLNSTHRLSAIDRKGEIELILHPNNTVSGFKGAIDMFIRLNKISENKEPIVQTQNNLLYEEDGHKLNEVIKEVKRNKHLVYQADLEQAIRHIINNEIPRVNDINDMRLLALQRFLNVLQRYNPLSPNGRAYVDKLQEYVTSNNQAITGKDFQDKVQQLEADYEPIYSSTQYVGCIGSKSNYRGFTCSLWKLFHFLTVQAAISDKSADPLEVLQAIHGIVKYFFGCTDCSEHFQEMANRRKIWSTPSKDEAVLWLWEAHNEVNNRLAGDETEDPQFPKVQFPTKDSCIQCQKNITSDPKTINWDRDAVLSFLKNINNPNYISRYGLDNPDILQPSVEKLRQKRMIGNVFSDMDMRMGMLLYGFCIVMMIVAFKLFAYKGYRKKVYAHDFLGKV